MQRIFMSGVMLLLANVSVPADVPAAKVVIRADFPGGNVLVEQNSGAVVRIAPDLRGGRPWFHWHFEAEAREPGRVTFMLSKPPQVGVRGPAVSDDAGKTWRWLGAEHVRFAQADAADPELAKTESFSFDFQTAGQRVRFAVSVPYLPHDLADFLARQVTNRHLRRSVLCRTRAGTEVELLQVGEPSPDKLAVLMTARHHACEALASYVLEGILEEAISESAAAVEFRRRHVLYVVPLVDRDGVQAGDQGKNRLPHDHNRDYGPTPIYPEIAAIQALGEEHDIRIALDLHCPALRGDIHEAFHFLGLGLPHVKDNLDEFIRWIGEERPPVAMAPLNFLIDPKKPRAIDPRINSHHFALRPRSLLAATLEVPYAQPHVPLDATLARHYGRSLLPAFVRTRLLPADSTEARGASGHEVLSKLRTEFGQSYRGKPQANEERLNALLSDVTTPSALRVEAQSLLVTLRLHQKDYAAAIKLAQAVESDPHASVRQRAAALVQRLQAVTAQQASTPEDVQAAVEDALNMPYVSPSHQARCWELASDFDLQRGDYASALKRSQQRLPVAASYEKGKVLNHIAELYDFQQQPAQAIATRKEAVAYLREQLEPTPPRSIFGALMLADLFEAINALPESTAAEKQAAAAMVFEHPIAPEELKNRVRKALGQ